MTAIIHSLVYQPGKSVHKPPFRYNRLPVDQFTLIADHGIEGDYKAGRSKKRQLNVMLLETVQELEAEGLMCAPGQLGEQVVISGLDAAQLQPRVRLQFGDSAVIELTSLREPCAWFEAIQGKPKEQVIGRVGYMARVITGGIVRIGDTVALTTGTIQTAIPT